jgi:hypothetical protein
LILLTNGHQIITTIICPDDLIATVSALTLSIRVIGGSIGYCAYYNVFVSKFVPNAIKYIGGAAVSVGVTNETYIGQIIGLTGASLIEDIKLIPGIAGNDTAWEIVVYAGQVAFAESYKWVCQSRVLDAACTDFHRSTTQVLPRVVSPSLLHASWVTFRNTWMTMLLSCSLS